MLAALVSVPTAVAAAAPSTEAPGGGVARDGVVLPEDPAEADLSGAIGSLDARRERQGYEGGEHGTNSEIIAERFESAGAYVTGRRMADGGEVPGATSPRSTRRCSSSPIEPGKP